MDRIQTQSRFKPIGKCDVRGACTAVRMIQLIERQQSNVTSAPSSLAGEGQGRGEDKNDIFLLTDSSKTASGDDA